MNSIYTVIIPFIIIGISCKNKETGSDTKFWDLPEIIEEAKSSGLMDDIYPVEGDCKSALDNNDDNDRCITKQDKKESLIRACDSFQRKNDTDIEEREDLLNSYYKRLTSKDPKIYQKAAVSWARYEANCSTLLPNASVYEEFVDTQMAINLARLEAHYFVNKLFLKEGQLLNNINNIFHIKGYIIQGRYDAICPIKSAYDLADAWPNANLRIIEAAGHSSIEKPIQNALMETTEEIKKTIG